MNRAISRRSLLASAAAPLLAAGSRPNIVFIISDDHHWQCIGANGNPHVRTPNIDRLASRGVNFTQGIISSSQCAPSRGILLSGVECYQNGLDSNGHTGFRFFKGRTAVEQLRQSGYETTLVGKWHIDPNPRDVGFSRAPLWKQPAAGVYRNPELRRGFDGKDESVPGHITDLFTDAAVQSIQAAKNPYLLWLAYTAPHQPWSVDEKYTTPYKGRNSEIAPPAHPRFTGRPASFATKGGGKKGGGKKGGEVGAQNLRPDGTYDWETYYGVISHLDEAVGRVISAVEKSGQWDNTLVVFLGDNGYLCGAKGLQGKVEMWEPSIRVPYIVSGGLVKRAAKSDAPVASVDLPATFLDYAGVKPGHKLSGASLRGVLEGKKFPREAAFSAWNDGRPEALLVPRTVEPYRVARTPSLKYVQWESGKEALFDLAADGAEEKNLAAGTDRAADLKRMRGIMGARMKSTADPAAAWPRNGAGAA